MLTGLTTCIRTICQSRTGRIGRRTPEIQKPTRSTNSNNKRCTRSKNKSGRSCNKSRTRNINAPRSRGLMTRESSRWSSGISNRRSKCSKDMNSSNREWSSVSRRLRIRVKGSRRSNRESGSFVQASRSYRAPQSTSVVLQTASSPVTIRTRKKQKLLRVSLIQRVASFLKGARNE